MLRAHNQTADTCVDTKLLAKLPPQRFFVGFSRFRLSSGELPFPTKMRPSSRMITAATTETTSVVSVVLLGAFELITPHFVVERATVDVQHLRGFRYVPIGALQHLFDVLPLHIV